MRPSGPGPLDEALGNRAPAVGRRCRRDEALRLAFGAHRRALAATLLLAVVEATGPIATAWLTKQLIDSLTGYGTREVTATAAALASIGVLLALLPYVDDLCQGVLTRAVALTAQDRLFRAVNAHPGLDLYEDPVRLDRLRLAQQSGQDTVPVG
jgi:ATP-binding cassette subfamily B protein